MAIWNIAYWCICPRSTQKFYNNTDRAQKDSRPNNLKNMKPEDKENLQSAKGCMVIGTLIAIGGIAIAGVLGKENESAMNIGLFIVAIGALIHFVGRAQRWWYRDK
jgi:hypothetical protein